MNAIPRSPTPVNEPILSYAPGTAERAELKRALKEMSGQPIEIPLVIGGREVRTGRTVSVAMPHCHRHVLATVHQAGAAEIDAAIAAAPPARRGASPRAVRGPRTVGPPAAGPLGAPLCPPVN